MKKIINVFKVQNQMSGAWKNKNYCQNSTSNQWGMKEQKPFSKFIINTAGHFKIKSSVISRYYFLIIVQLFTTQQWAGCSSPKTQHWAGCSSPKTQHWAGCSSPKTQHWAGCSSPKTQHWAGCSSPKTQHWAGCSSPKTQHWAGCSTPKAPSSLDECLFARTYFGHFDELWFVS